MPNNNKTPKTFLDRIKPWIQGEQISVYLQGRAKPVSGVTVCSVSSDVLIGRWNSSTHLIPLEAIAYIRFAPDSDPCRRPQHPLHDLVQSHRPQGSLWQPPSKPYFRVEGDVKGVGDIIGNMKLPGRKEK